ncbi:PAS domain S-box protein [Sulfuricurvum sp.]|uniref:PAS domain S-box protein n=1 Tax=Sulfuricurvum sp. TaxID=2025608 RepID=UPI002E33DB88|nr:PAS domain S-box protein [Sulfuricurvum sp.]HEX5330651.1 PAS domain S-box protein [Sulfuricurvum sp.]
MKLLNHLYQNYDELERFCTLHDLEREKSVLIQLFGSDQSNETLYRIRSEICSLMPHASLIATTSGGNIDHGMIVDSHVTLSFSIFERTDVRAVGYKSQNLKTLIDDLAENYVKDDTKLLIVFANMFRLDSALFMDMLARRFPNCNVAGGNSGNDFPFMHCEVFSTDVDDCDVVVAALSSIALEVRTEHLLNIQTIGQEMEVTKASGNVVYEINHQSPLALYAHYLGDDVAENILKFWNEFGLIFKIGDIDVARAVVSFDKESGSITFAGGISEGTSVKFGYANIEHIEKLNHQILSRQFNHKKEAIYVYSCGARRQILGKYYKDELSILDQIAPTTGFMTYGEFFHDAHTCRNALLNMTTTIAVLSENPLNDLLTINPINREKNQQEIAIKALTTLVTKTSEDLDRNINYLEQFKNAIKEASIFSITDDKGIIQDVNKNFEIISGYSREELIGSPHNIIRSPDTPKEVFAQMWQMIQCGMIWKGLLKNRRKNGEHYYVVTQITPIYNYDGSFKEYVSIRIDVTELEEYKLALKYDLDTTSKNFEEHRHYAAQYEEAINSTTAIIKTDTENLITSVNEKFCLLSGFETKELIGRNCEAFRHEKHRQEGICKQIHAQLLQKKTVHKKMTNIAKNGDEYVTENFFYPVSDLPGNVIETIQIMHDVTEIVNLNKEIIDTQREIVTTMGMIGETRSLETGLHVKRVAEYSYLLAKLIGLSEEDATLLKEASPMHDIGKVGIPDHILNKPGRITPEEFDLIKTHAEIGYELLKHSQREILKASAVVAYTHHERWDGKGYPRGLIAEEIPIYGRITAVADVFDALGHDRIYKAAWPLEKILELFREERGKQFDPTMIDLFFEHLDQFLAIRDRMQDREV